MTKRIFIIGLITLGSLMSQGDPPAPPAGGSTGNSGTNGPPVGAPVDGGLGLLLIFGAGYAGVKKVRAALRPSS